MEQSGSDKHVPTRSRTSDRRAVARATGVLVSQFGINTEDAFEKLIAEAADNGRPVIDVAREIVENAGL